LQKITRRILKILAWIIAGILLLILLVLILIQVPAVQNFARKKAVTYLQGKLHTQVAIGKLTVDFPKRIVLHDVFFGDQKNDTLLSGKELRVDIALFKLLSKQIDVNYVELNGITSHIYRVRKDTLFNYDYVIKAFSSHEKQPAPKDTTPGFTFSVNRIVLKDIHLRFKDDMAGSDAQFNLASFDTHISKFDPAKMIYHIASIETDGIDTRIHQYKPILDPSNHPAKIATDTSRPITPVDFQLKNLTITHTRFNYANDVSGLFADLNLGQLSAHPEKIDLVTLGIRLKDLRLDSTTASVTEGKAEPVKKIKDTVVKKVIEQSDGNWNFQIAKLSLNHDDLSFDNNNAPHQKKAVDYSHLHVKEFNFTADSLVLTPAQYQGNVRQLAFREQSGFDLKQFQAHFFYNGKGAYLRNLLLQTDQTVLRRSVAITYPSLAEIASHPGDLFIDGDLTQCTIGLKDVLLFAPQLTSQLRGNGVAAIHLNSRIKGYLKDLSIPLLELSGYGNTYVKLTGSVKGLPDAMRSYYNINIEKLTTVRKDITRLVSASALPSSIRIPESISLHGYFRGAMKDFNTHAILQTSNGNADITAQLTNNTSYSVQATADAVNLGYILKQDSLMGKVSAHVTLTGTGTDYKKATAKFQASVSSAELKGYTYHDFEAQGTADKGIIKATAAIKDSNIRLKMDATADVGPKYPAVKMKLALDTLNLYALHLSRDTISLHANLVADMPVTNPDSLVGMLDIRNIAIVNAGRRLNTDSILFVAHANGLQKDMSLTSDVVRMTMKGQYRLTEVGQALEQVINKYYSIPGYRTASIAPQDWELDATVIPASLLLQIVPGLKGSDSILLKTTFKSDSGLIDLSARSKKLIYNGQQADSLNITSKTNGDHLDFGASVMDVKSSAINLYRTSLSGTLRNNQADIALNEKDQKGKDQYHIGALIKSSNTGFLFNLKPDLLMLDYDKWTVNADNSIQYDSAGIIVRNLTISDKGGSFSVNSTPQTPNSPIKVDFTNFQIASITKIAHQDNLLVQGILNGNVLIRNINSTPLFTADMKVDNLMYQKDTVGNLIVKIDNQTANAFAANIALSGNNNDVQLNGNYYVGESRLDMKLAMNQLNLASVRPFVLDQIKDMRGFLKGNLAVSGNMMKPQLKGQLVFDNALITPVITGEPLKLSGNKIDFDEDGFNFSEFTLLDSANNKMVIDGNVFTPDFKNYRFDVSVSARNFKLVNAPQASKRLFYGRLNLDTDFDLKGDMDSPTMVGDIQVNKETDFTLILPSNDPEVVDRAGVVRFVDKDHPDSSVKFYTALDSLSNQSKIKGMDVSITVETDSAAQFTMIIDERNGDALSLRGKADLVAGIDKSGKTSLTGAYQLERGSYNLSLSFLKRRFDIQKGSTVTWTGDPTSAQVDITAIYLANAAPIDLVEPQLVGRAQTDINRFKQKLPFQVNLKMEGDLLKPAITFDITLNSDMLSQWPDVDAKLQQIRNDQSELNKQVFALLLLNRFVGENPLVSDAGSRSAGDIAKQSAGKILTDQLNQLAGNLVKGVDISFDFNTQQDYSSGQEASYSDLTVGVSKKLFNDRIQVTVGSNFEMESEGPPANKDASNVAGDVAVDYRLSKDGRYMLRAYRKNDYEGVIEGQVIETGVSFIFTLDYNKFREIFQKVKPVPKAIRKQRKNPTPPADPNNVKKP